MTLADHLLCAMSVGALRARLKRAEDEKAELLWRIKVQQIEINRRRAQFPGRPIQATSTGVTT